MRTFTITEAARLIGVPAATVSRRLPSGRASRGRGAHLSVQEISDIAVAVHVDPNAVQRRVALIDELGPDMPSDAPHWAEVAADRDLDRALRAHRDRTPPDLLDQPPEAGCVELPPTWGELDEWTLVSTQAQLEALLPPLER